MSRGLVLETIAAHRLYKSVAREKIKVTVSGFDILADDNVPYIYLCTRAPYTMSFTTNINTTSKDEEHIPPHFHTQQEKLW